MNKTKIAWTDMTWNPVTGCTKCSPGCQNCYAEKMAYRLNKMNCIKYFNGFKVTLHPESLTEPGNTKGFRKVFVCSMGDLFHKDVPDDYIDKVMNVISSCHEKIFIILTKRSERMAEYFKDKTISPNVWLGVTVECQNAVKRIDDLKKVKAENVKFLSCEPLIEDLGELKLDGIDWVIAGGESGSQARAMNPLWLKSIKNECERQNVSFFFKQWGTWGEDGKRRSKSKNGCLINGKKYQAWPDNSYYKKWYEQKIKESGNK